MRRRGNQSNHMQQDRAKVTAQETEIEGRRKKVPTIRKGGGVSSSPPPPANLDFPLEKKLAPKTSCAGGKYTFTDCHSQSHIETGGRDSYKSPENWTNLFAQHSSDLEKGGFASRQGAHNMPTFALRHKVPWRLFLGH